MRRTLAWSAGLTALAMVATAANVEAVPSFTRQTGLTCNQCHITFGGPVPNFTFTGKKFRINGYRMPFIAEKIEAGEPGEVSGKRLSMPLAPYLSLRYQSSFLAQSKSPGASEAGPVTSNPTSRLAIFPAGAVGDHIGLWAEMYLIPEGNTGREWSLGLFSYDEYDLRFVKITDKSTIGFAFSNQSMKEVSGFGPWGLPTEFGRGGVGGYAHPNRGNIFAYGWFNDQIFAVVGASPGEDNLDWDKRNYQASLQWAPLHSDQNELWLAVFTQFGNDALPVVSNTSIRGTSNGPTWVYSDAIDGISKTRPSNAQRAYVSADMGDHMRTAVEARYGFIDRGPHSIENAVGFAVTRETFSDNAEYRSSRISARTRYAYDRTWGVDLQLSKDLNTTFKDWQGVEHGVKSKLGWTTWLTYRPAMNFMFVLSYGNSQRLALDQTSVPTGWNWSLTCDFLF